MRPDRPVALVTGASSGIGEAIARTLAESGFDLALGARRMDRVEALAAELRAKGVRVHAGAVDTRDTESVRAFVEGAASALGALHVVVANAGLARGLDKVWEIPDEDLEAMLRTNVEGVVKTIRFALPHVRKSGWGHIVFIGSTAGHQSYEGGGVYCASKHGVKALSHSLRLELCGEPIRVTSVDPGMVDTEFSLVRFHDAERAKSVYAGMEPLRASDVAECVRWSLMLPERVNVDEVIVKPRDQASHTGAKVARRS
ncbi:MAG TPA: SDR family NAD(P)-dependent oxidoreductase [Holophagaceae bacterium]|jgi:3-hydroxy acid dehydrogenase/malonic semialdehyde reductase|nr:SDR family NAD(P)-dependent oxidoreductase [Holophagaceae bacterium]